MDARKGAALTMHRVFPFATTEDGCSKGCCSSDAPSVSVATTEDGCSKGCCSSEASSGLDAEDTMKIDNVDSESECLWTIKVDELEDGMEEDAKAILNLLREIDGVLAVSVNMEKKSFALKCASTASNVNEEVLEEPFDIFALDAVILKA